MDNIEIRSLPLELKVGQLFFIGLPGPELDDVSRKLIAEISPGGICLFSRNIREAQQTRDLTDGIRELSAVEPFLSLDQEGGLVDRLRRLITPMPPASAFKSADDVGRFGKLVAKIIRMLGLNMDFAPVVDVVDEERSRFSNGLYSRTFGRSAADVADLAGAFLRELQAEGCIGCIKHFPGLGASDVDSHEELPAVEIENSEFESTDLSPYGDLFRTGNVHSVMVAHAAYPRLDLQETDQNGKLLPSSLSYNVVSKLLRGKLAFDGLVLTDDLEMGAILKNYGIDEACRLAILAGEDMLSICAGVESIYSGYSAILDSVRSGAIAEERIDRSLTRIARVKSLLSRPSDLDVVQLQELSREISLLIQTN